MIPCTIESINHNMSLGPGSGGLIKGKIGLAGPRVRWSASADRTDVEADMDRTCGFLWLCSIER